MRPPAKRKRTVLPVLLPVQQAKRWQLRMFPNTPSALLTTLLKSLRQVILPMPRLNLPRNLIGNHGVFQKT